MGDGKTSSVCRKHDPSPSLHVWAEIRDPEYVVGVGVRIGVRIAVRVVVVVGVVAVGVHLVERAFSNTARSPRRSSPAASGLHLMIPLPPIFWDGQRSETQNKTESVLAMWSGSRSKLVSWSVLSSGTLLGGTGSWSGSGSRLTVGSVSLLWHSETGHGPESGPGLSPLDYLR